MDCTQAILPVAGLGTRFLPWTKVVPKELLPIGNQPIIALLVDECLSVGITDICFVISPGKEAIARYFEKAPALERELAERGKSDLLSDLSRYNEVRLHVVHQHRQRGDGDALLQAADWVRPGTVAVLFGDDLILGRQNGLQQMIDARLRLPENPDTCLLCLENIDREETSRYGVIDPDHTWNAFDGDDMQRSTWSDRIRKVRGLVEKPRPEDAPSTLGIVGRYLIPSSLFPVLEGLQTGSKDGEIRLIDAFIEVQDRFDVYGHVLEGIRLDTGTPEGYRDAVRMLDPVTLELEQPMLVREAMTVATSSLS